MFTTLTLIFQTLKGSQLPSQLTDLDEIRIHPCFTHVFLPTRMKTIKAKMKVLECTQLFSHCKYMMICSDAQGKLTLQSEVGSGRNLNSSKLLRLPSLHARIKPESARVATLYINFSDAKGQKNSGVIIGIWRKFELIQAFMHGLVTCKNEDDSIKKNGLEWSQRFC